MELIKFVNGVLAFIAVILAVNLTTPGMNIFGAAVLSEDIVDGCLISTEGGTDGLALEHCCPVIERMHSCKKQDNSIYGWRCENSPDATRSIVVKQQTINFCEQEGYNVRFS